MSSGDKAVATGAMIQALGQYVEAVRVLGEMPETPDQMRRRVDITLRLSQTAVFRPSKELRELLRSCYELSERLGDPRAASYSLYWMGFLEHSLGSWAASRDYFERCMARAEEQRDARLLSMVYANQGQTLFQMGDYPESMRLLEDCCASVPLDQRERGGALHRVSARIPGDDPRRLRPLRPRRQTTRRGGHPRAR